RLRDLPNTVIVVEHDEETIRTADTIVDIGPGAGEHGGEIVVCGSLDDVIAEPRSITGKYLAGERSIPVPEIRRQPGGARPPGREGRGAKPKSIHLRFPPR